MISEFSVHDWLIPLSLGYSETEHHSEFNLNVVHSLLIFFGFVFKMRSHYADEIFEVQRS
jgi:hypothetical protein